MFAKEVLALGAAGLGYLAAAPGLVTIMGSLCLAARGRVETRSGPIFVILLGVSMALFGFAVSRHIQLSFALLVVGGSLSTVFETLLQPSIQLTVEESFHGRVLGFYGLSGGGLREFGGMQGGFLAEWAGAPAAIEMETVVMILMSAMFLGAAGRRKAAAFLGNRFIKELDDSGFVNSLYSAKNGGRVTHRCRASTAQRSVRNARNR